jgi:hypothetical protein
MFGMWVRVDGGNGLWEVSEYKNFFFLVNVGRFDFLFFFGHVGFFCPGQENKTVLCCAIT